MKNKDEKRKMEELHQRRVNQMIKSAEGRAGLVHKITKHAACRGGAQILKKEEEDAATHWQRASSLYKAKTGVGCDGFHPNVPLDLTKETRGKIVEFLEKVEQRGN